MKYRFIGNELFIANKIKLSFNEKSILILFLTLEELQLEDISMTLNINVKTILEIIKQLNLKLGHFFVIKRVKRVKRKNQLDSFYKLIKKEKD